MNKFSRLIAIAMLLIASLRLDAQLQALTIGDKLPDLSASIINYPKNEIRLSEFLGKPIIIDFWATTCVSCIRSFLKIDTLEKLFANDLVILPVTVQNSDQVNRLQASLNKNIGLAPHYTVIRDKSIRKLFPHRLIPHYVWIDKNGYVKAITGSEELTSANVKALVDGKELNLPLKGDSPLAWDGRKPLYSSGLFSLGAENLYHSIISRYRSDLPNGSYSAGNIIDCPNHTIAGLFALAFGEFSFKFLNPNRYVLEGVNGLADSLTLGLFTKETRPEWKKIEKENRYTYELSVDSSYSRKEKFQIMQQDLNRYFKHKGIEGKLEKRKQKVIALIRTSSQDKIATKGGKSADQYSSYFLRITNFPVSRFISKFQAYFYDKATATLPIEDFTGYAGKIDIDINCDLKDLEAVNKQIERYDLKFVEREAEIEMLVITMKK